MDIYIEEDNNIEYDLIFTRYLYIKQEVKLALLVSLLNKNTEQALFWINELYYSGFINELLEYIFKIYYDFYASLNGGFETYLLKKTKEILKSKNHKDCIKVFELMIQNIISRPYNLDTFMLINICNLFDIECDYDVASINKEIINWINNEDYITIAEFVLNKNKELNELDIYILVIDSFILLNCEINKNKLIKEFSRYKIANLNAKHILLAKIMELFVNLKKIVKGKNKYISSNVNDNENLNDISHINRNWKVLSCVCKYSVDEYECLGMFKLYRNNVTNDDLFNIYNSKWEYYASGSPYWNDKITSCCGFIDHTNKIIIFDDELISNEETLFEKFHNTYDFEPDEQPMEIKNKSIGKINPNTDLEKFYKKYKTQGLFDVDTEFLTETIGSKIFYTK